MSKKWSSRYNTEPDQEPVQTSRADRKQSSIISPVRQKLDCFFDHALCGMALDIPLLNAFSNDVLLPECHEKDSNYYIVFDISSIEVQHLCIALENNHLIIQYHQSTITTGSQQTDIHNHNPLFRQRIRLPEDIDKDTITAAIEGSQLSISVDKKEVVTTQPVTLINIQKS